MLLEKCLEHDLPSKNLINPNTKCLPARQSSKYQLAMVLNPPPIQVLLTQIKTSWNKMTFFCQESLFKICFANHPRTTTHCTKTFNPISKQVSYFSYARSTNNRRQKTPKKQQQKTTNNNQQQKKTTNTKQLKQNKKSVGWDLATFFFFKVTGGKDRHSKNYQHMDPQNLKETLDRVNCRVLDVLHVGRWLMLVR